MKAKKWDESEKRFNEKFLSLENKLSEQSDRTQRAETKIKIKRLSLANMTER